MPLSGSSRLFQNLPQLVSHIQALSFQDVVSSPSRVTDPRHFAASTHNSSAAQDVPPSCTPPNDTPRCLRAAALSHHGKFRFSICSTCPVVVIPSTFQGTLH